MKNRNLKLISMLLLIGIFLTPIVVVADDENETDEHEPGQMLIDREVLQDGREIDQTQVRAIGHEVAPFLFLEEMMEVELRRAQYNEAFLANARETAFLGEDPHTGLDTAEIDVMLFATAEYSPALNVATRTYMGYFHIPPWLFVVGGIVSIVFLVYVAMILGKKLGHLIHTKKEDEVSG
jgi:hypothetical protein